MNSLVSTLHPSQVTTIDVSHLHHDSYEASCAQKYSRCLLKMLLALGSLSKFFDLPMDQKTIFLSNDVKKPVGFRESSSSFMPTLLKIGLAHGLIIPQISQNLGKYAIEVRRLSLEIMEAIVESLGLPPTNLRSSLEKGMHMIVGNKYPQCSPSSNILGLASHTDHTIITILLESMSGLEIMDSNDNNAWKSVPATGSTLKVLIGNRLEVLGNGLYKSVFHRVTSNAQMSRVSIGSCLSFPMEEMVEPAMELVDEEHPKRYRASRLEEYIKFLSSKEDESYIESLKI